MIWYRLLNPNVITAQLPTGSQAWFSTRKVLTKVIGYLPALPLQKIKKSNPQWSPPSVHSSRPADERNQRTAASRDAEVLRSAASQGAEVSGGSCPPARCVVGLGIFWKSQE